MFPTSNTVKLNRITLKDVVGLKIGPRKRRTPNKAADESLSKTCKHVLSEPASGEAAASVCGDRDRPSFTLTPAASSERKDTTRDNAGGRPQENHAAIQRAKRRSDLQPCMAPPDTIDFIQNAHLNPPGLPGSKHCRRRSGGASLFVVYGECQCVSPQPKASGPDPAPSPPAFKGHGGKRAEGAALCTNKYPKVTLCDVAARCAVCSHGCGYVIPDELRAKTMRCFKQGMRAGFRIWPSCSGHSRRDGERGAEVKSSTGGPGAQKGNGTASLTEQRKRPEEGARSEASTSPSKHFCNGWMEADHTPAGPLLSEKREGGVGSAGVDQDPQGDAGVGSDRLGLELGGDKRTRLEDGVQCSRASSFVDAISKARLPGGPAETNAEQMSPDEFGEGGEENTAESFTCQRVKPYFKKRPSSCARTYMPWPFPNSRTRCAAGASAAGLSERSVASSERSAGDSITDNQDLLSSSSGENHSVLSHAFGGKMSASVQANLKTAELSVQSEGSVGRLPSRPLSFPGPAQHGQEPGTEAGRFPFSRPDTDGSTSPAPRSAPSPSDWETSSALSNLSDLSAHDASSCPFSTPCSVPPLALPSGAVQNAEGKPVGLRQDENNNNNNGRLPASSPPRLEPFDASPFKPKRLSLGNVVGESCVDADSGGFLLPPVLSPVSSPCRRILERTSFPSGSEDTEEVLNRDETPAGSDTAQEVNGNCESSRDLPEHHEGVAAALRAPADITAFKPASSPSDADGGEEDNPGHSESSSEEAPLDPDRKAAVCSEVLPEGVPSPSSQDEEHASLTDEEEDGSGSDSAEGDEREAGTVKEESAILDEFTAYEQDILLVDVVQEDPELFENLPEKSVLNLGPVRDPAAPKKKAIPRITFSAQTERPSPATDQRFPPVAAALEDDEESESRPWRPRCGGVSTKGPNPCPVAVSQSRHVGPSAENNRTDGKWESNLGHPIKKVSFSHSVPPVTALQTGPATTTPATRTDPRCQKSNGYCRLYFSESLSCGYKMCRFKHLPVEGDEKFCVDTVAKFSKHPACLLKAGAVFTGYYQNSPPGAYFSMPVLLTLLWALLKAGMVSQVFSVLHVSLAHNIVPDHEFLLALFNYVRDKGLQSLIPELMELTFKMAGVGLELSLDWMENVKNTPMFQQTAHQTSHDALVGNHNPELLNLLHGIVEIELCVKQEDWKRMGEVYKALCQFSQHPNQVERISGRIAVALLSESKDKVSLPFAAFAETACQGESGENLVKSFLGRIGVTLMLRYHKNQHWSKGCRVVEVMSVLKVDYTVLKSLFGNEHGASRCYIISVAAELFFLSGSVEGALKTLREHNWFLSSSSWPCEPADLERRTNVLRRLAGKTSYRDTLEVLCNLPGVKEPNDLIDISRYSPLFASHLQVCVERQILPVASDTLDFMLCKKLAVEHPLLQTVLDKLGKQNLWLRARELFKHSLNVGYYPGVSAAPSSMALIVPCQLGEVELAITLEMFVALNASAILPLSDTATGPALSITLRRTLSCEVEYISAGNRLLSAACLPQPKLTVHYIEVNSSQEQVFRLHVPTARRWLRHNHSWASEMWTQQPKCLNPN